MEQTSDSFLTGANIDFIEAQYARFLENPGSVDASWVELFRAQQASGRPLITDGLQLAAPAALAPPAAGLPAAAASGQAPSPAGVLLALQSKVDQTTSAFRSRGHLLSTLDPLGLPRPALEHIADYGMVSRAHFDAAELKTAVDPHGVFDASTATVLDILARLRSTYTRSIGVEIMHIADSERRRWLMRRMEHSENRTDFSADEQRRFLKKLSEAEAFEQTIHTKFQAAKRFSIEGGESLIPMLDAFLELGAGLGLREVVVGMAHRGRLNVLCNFLGKPAANIFSEFVGPQDPMAYLNRGDVKYHLGYSKDHVSAQGHTVHVSMAFNPSHLGMVHPVVEGRVRAKQDRLGANGKHAICPLVLHGDAAFSGQGLVAETLNLAGLSAYDTGGTVHVVINNQIGYTTEGAQGRTPLYCTAQALMLDVPIFHVNGDDVEACVHVMRLATEYRQRFHTDVVIDLVCFRRYGHNEGDEPAFTQPQMYELIRQHPTVRAVYGQQLIGTQRFTAEEVEQLRLQALTEFSQAHADVKEKNQFQEPDTLGGIWANHRGGADKDTPHVDTGVGQDKLDALLHKLSETPAELQLHHRVQQVLERRKKMIGGREPLDWAAGELLAYASLLAEGANLRLTGQDTERGTFSHRHAVLHDVNSPRTAFPLGNLGLGPQGKALVANSPLSEMACLGFEFGYSLDAPDSLVAWEAQFGDFSNNAQVIIDQFIAAAEDKWKRLSGLTLLLPHGYEGAGPEHSSARLERFLELAAEDNLQICYPTSAAQMFHLLRRQVLRKIRKPLVILTPKSLLRMAEASSPMSEFSTGRFRRVIAETSPKVESAKVSKLLLCSGKVYFDLAKAREASAQWNVAIVRVEQLYPLPEELLKTLLSTMPQLQEVVWVQEEPKNAGAWRALLEPLGSLLTSLPGKPRLRYAGRVESASPATGHSKAHEVEQKLLVDEALKSSAS